MFSRRRHVYVENRVRLRVYEKRDFQLLNRQLRSLRVVFRGVTPVEAGGVDTDDTVGREECDREIEKDTPDSHIESIERFTQRRGRREFLKVDGAPNPGHLDEFVEKRSVRRILPNLETQQNDVLVECIPAFRELRGVPSDSSSSQVIRLLNKPE